MNFLYLWNGYLFVFLVKLEEYFFVVEVDEEIFKKNEEMFLFLIVEVDKCGIFVIQMFYNILLSKFFVEYYGLKIQDCNCFIILLISDYICKLVVVFIEKYFNVGLLVCLGEVMDIYEDDVEWFIKIIILGVKDGLNVLGCMDELFILLCVYDMDCKMVMDVVLLLYKNFYIMYKYNGELLIIYELCGFWFKIYLDLSVLGSIYISNVYILVNLELWCWGFFDFVQKVVNVMYNVYGVNVLYLYLQVFYWDWLYMVDKLVDGKWEYQLDCDWIWYKMWGCYVWNCYWDCLFEVEYWDKQLGDFYGMIFVEVGDILEVYEQSGEIVLKLFCCFGIMEGNWQILLLGMFMSQLVNFYKYIIYLGFYESCGLEGEKLIEYVEKEWKKQLYVGELLLDIVVQVVEYGDKVVVVIDKVVVVVICNKEEFGCLWNDMYCYCEFVYVFNLKVKVVQCVLNYQWGKELNELDVVILLME